MKLLGFLKRKNKCDTCPIKSLVEKTEMLDTQVSNYLMKRMDEMIDATHNLKIGYLKLLEENAKLIKENKQLKGKVKVEFT